MAKLDQVGIQLVMDTGSAVGNAKKYNDAMLKVMKTLSLTRLQFLQGSDGLAKFEKKLDEVTSKAGLANVGITKLSTSITKQGVVTKATVGIIKDSTKKVDSFGTSVANATKKLAPFLVALVGVQTVQRVFRNTVSDLNDLNQAFANLQKVVTSEIINTGALQKEVLDLGKQYGILGSEVAENITIFAQQGNTIAKSLELSKAAILAANAANITLQESVEALTAATKVYKGEANNLVGIVDKLIAVQAKHAVTAQDLANSFKAVGNAARLVGVDINSLIGLTTAIAAVTRKSGKAVGNSLKTIFSRINKSEAKQALQEIANIDVFKELDANGKPILKSFDEVITELSGSWGELNRSQQFAIANSIGGIRRYGDFLALMDNFDEAIDATSDSLLANGEAAAASAQQVKTINAQIIILRNNTTDIFSNFLPTSKQVVFVMETFNGILKATSDGLTAFSNQTLFAVKGLGSIKGSAIIATAVIAPLVVAVGSLATAVATGLGVAAAPAGALAIFLGGMTALGATINSFKTSKDVIKDLGEAIDKLESKQANINKVFTSTELILRNTDSSESARQKALVSRAKALGLVSAGIRNLREEEELLDIARNRTSSADAFKLSALKEQEAALDKIGRTLAKTIEETDKEFSKLRSLQSDFVTASQVAAATTQRFDPGFGRSRTRTGLNIRPEAQAEIINIPASREILDTSRDFLGKIKASFLKHSASIAEIGGDTLKEELEGVTTTIAKVEQTLKDLDGVSLGTDSPGIKKLSRDLLSLNDAFNELATNAQIETAAEKIDRFVIGTVLPLGKPGIEEGFERTMNRLTKALNLEGLTSDVTIAKFKAINGSFDLLKATAKGVSSAVEAAAGEFLGFEKAIETSERKINGLLNDIAAKPGNKSTLTAAFEQEFGLRDADLGAILARLRTEVTKSIKGGTEGQETLIRFLSVDDSKEGQALVIEIQRILALTKITVERRDEMLKKLLLARELHEQIRALQSEEALGEFKVKSAVQESLDTLKEKLNLRRKLFDFEHASIEEIFKLEVSSAKQLAEEQKKVSSSKIVGLKKLRDEEPTDNGKTLIAIDLGRQIRDEEKRLGTIIDANFKKRVAALQTDRDTKISKRDELRIMAQINTKFKRLLTLSDSRLSAEKEITLLGKFGIDATRTDIDLQKQKLLILEKIKLNRIDELRDRKKIDEEARRTLSASVRARTATDLQKLDIQLDFAPLQAFSKTKREILDSQIGAVSGLISEVPRELSRRKDEIATLQNQISLKNQQLQQELAIGNVAAADTLRTEIAKIGGELDILRDKTDIWGQSFLKVAEILESKITDQLSENLISGFSIFNNVAGGISNAVNQTNFSSASTQNKSNIPEFKLADPGIIKGLTATRRATDIGTAVQAGVQLEVSDGTKQAGTDARKAQGQRESGRKSNEKGFAALGQLLSQIAGSAVGGGGRGASLGGTVGSALGGAKGSNFLGGGVLGGLVGGLLGGLLGGLFDKKRAPATAIPIAGVIQKVEIANTASNPIPIRDVSIARPEERITLTTQVSLSLLDASQLNNDTVRKLADAIQRENEETLKKIGGGAITTL